MKCTKDQYDFTIVWGQTIKKLFMRKYKSILVIKLINIAYEYVFMVLTPIMCNVSKLRRKKMNEIICVNVLNAGKKYINCKRFLFILRRGIQRCRM